ncbi:MAG: hypothetical protein M1824_005490 [Vezdaea acicularis]|nr:MAG: hypothetical protein M1824_005490 [Vezdaea acicularis]
MSNMKHTTQVGQSGNELAGGSRQAFNYSGSITTSLRPASTESSAAARERAALQESQTNSTKDKTWLKARRDFDLTSVGASHTDSALGSEVEPGNVHLPPTQAENAGTGVENLRNQLGQNLNPLIVAEIKSFCDRFPEMGPDPASVHYYAQFDDQDLLPNDETS